MTAKGLTSPPGCSLSQAQHPHLQVSVFPSCGHYQKT